MTIAPTDAEQQSRLLRKVLHQRRLELGLSRSKLARLFDVDESSIERWETKEKSNPKFDKLLAWAKALGLECQIQVAPA